MTASGKPLHIIDIITMFNNVLPHCTLTLSKRHSFLEYTFDSHMHCCICQGERMDLGDWLTSSVISKII